MHPNDPRMKRRIMVGDLNTPHVLMDERLTTSVAAGLVKKVKTERNW